MPDFSNSATNALNDLWHKLASEIVNTVGNQPLDCPMCQEQALFGEWYVLEMKRGRS